MIIFFVVEGPLNKENSRDVTLLETMRVLGGEASMQSKRSTFEESCSFLHDFAFPQSVFSAL